MNTDRYKVLNRDVIKYIAIVAMLCNHIGHQFDIKSDVIYEFCQHVGYFTAPTMCYFLVEGYHLTHDRAKYGLRLLIFAIISQLCYIQVCDNDSTNMIATLTICFMILITQDKFKNKYIKTIASIAWIVLSIVINCNWQFAAPVFVIALNKYRDNRKGTAVSFAGLYIFHTLVDAEVDRYYTAHTFASCLCHGILANIPILLSGFCLLYLYNGKRSEHCKTLNKWAFYIIYPLHFLLLSLIN